MLTKLNAVYVFAQVTNQKGDMAFRNAQKKVLAFVT